MSLQPGTWIRVIEYTKRNATYKVLHALPSGYAIDTGNEGEYPITFAEPALSLVADLRKIGRMSAQEFMWDDVVGRWYHEFDPWFFSHREREAGK